MDHATKTDWSYRVILAGGVATNDSGELAGSSTATTSTTDTAAAVDSESEADAGDRAVTRSTGSTEPTAEASERLEGRLLNTQLVSGDVASSVEDEAVGNVSDIGDAEARVEPRRNGDGVQVDESEDDDLSYRMLMSFLNHMLTSQAADVDDVVDDTVLPRDDNGDYYGVRNDDGDEKTPPSSASIASTQSLAVDSTADTQSSVVEQDIVPTLLIPADDDRESEDGSIKVDDELSKPLHWQEGKNDRSETLLPAVVSDVASQLFKQIISNSSSDSDVNSDIKSNVNGQVGLLQPDTNQTKSTADSTDEGTPVDLTANRESDKRPGHPEVVPLVSTIIESTTFPHPDSKNAPEPEPTSHGKQSAVESSDRYNAWSSIPTTTTVKPKPKPKPKPDIITKNGNFAPIYCPGRFVCDHTLFYHLRSILCISQVNMLLYTS